MSEYKFSDNKVRMSLFTCQFWNCVRGLAKILTYGAKKYPHPSTGDRSWRFVSQDAYMDAFERHMEYVRRDSESALYNGSWDDALGVDEDSGQLHIDHAIMNLMFIRHKMYGDVNLPINEPKKREDYEDVDTRKESSSVSEESTQGTKSKAHIPSSGIY